MTDHLETLRQYQAWRRGGEREMLPPKVIGEAIDAVMAELVELREEKRSPGAKLNGAKVQLRGGVAAGKMIT